MSHLFFPLALISALALGALAVSILALRGASAVLRAASERANAGRGQWEAALAAIRDSTRELAARVDELEQRPVPAALPGPPKAGLNLSKRSQALRMHRRGDPPAQIALALDIPLQEVDLLLKVHRIVLRSI